jgi:hypothetical protein
MTLDLIYELCDDCGHVRLHDGLSDDELERYYRSAPTPTRDSYRRFDDLNQSRAAFVRQHLDCAARLGTHEPARHRVIEVACAFGDFLVQFDDFEERIGIEPSLSRREEHECTAEGVRILPLMLDQVASHEPELMGTGNLVMALHVLEHVSDPGQFLRQMASLGSDDAVYYIEVPCLFTSVMSASSPRAH